VRGPSRITRGEPNTVELTIGARPENLALARLALAGVAAIAGASESTIADLKLAVTEACTNSIQHAYGANGADATVVIRYRVGNDMLEIEVEDGGAGFDPNDPAADSSDNGGGQGMGLMIIRSLADEVAIESDKSGSRIAFVKKIDRA
jgi:serine/threonine-protein kinase RsbW